MISDMIDHVNLPVSDVAASRAFYAVVLAVLDCVVVAEDGDAVGFGKDAWSFGLVPSADPAQVMHLAFKAASQAQVDRFHTAGLDAGATCNGVPGRRDHYGAGYYACYLIDPDGHNIEAVCRG